MIKTSVVRTKVLVDSTFLTFSVALQFPGASDTPYICASLQSFSVILIWTGHIRWDTHSDRPMVLGGLTRNINMVFRNDADKNVNPQVAEGLGNTLQSCTITSPGSTATHAPRRKPAL